MTGFLNIISNITHYAGVGMVLAAAGIVMIAVAIFRLVRWNAADRRASVAEFNQQFVQDTRYRIADVEAGSKRSEIAGKLKIGEKYRDHREEQ